VSLRIGLVGNNLRLWHDFVALVAQTRLNGASDSFIRGLHQNGTFSIKSMYSVLISDTRVVHSRTRWSLKIPLRIKKFMWYFKRGVVLTKAKLEWAKVMYVLFSKGNDTTPFSIVTLLGSSGELCK
jgi:hypothetical protein